MEDTYQPQSKTRNVLFWSYLAQMPFSPSLIPTSSPCLTLTPLRFRAIGGLWFSALVRAEWATANLPEPECWRDSGRRCWFPVRDAENCPGLCLCCHSLGLSASCWLPSWGHGNTKGILVLGRDCHSTLHWGDRTPNAGASLLPCCAWCPFLGSKQLWDSQTY